MMITAADKPSTEVLIPPTAKPGETLHVILSVRDTGTPPLTRYRRIVLMAK